MTIESDCTSQNAHNEVSNSVVVEGSFTDRLTECAAELQHEIASLLV
jgi:hypothetical protein